MPFAWRARGDMRIHSSSRCERPLPRWLSCFSSWASRCCFLLQPRRVVALPGNPAPAVELEDPAGHVVEEVAVVGDGDDRARVVLQEALEPGHRFRVEVVGRLVEQEQVRGLQQQPAERHAPAFAAGQGPTSASAGGTRRASIASSTRESSSQASAASIRSWRLPCCSRTFSISSGDSVLAQLARSAARTPRAAPASRPRPPRCCRGRSSPGRARVPGAGSRPTPLRPRRPRRRNRGRGPP